MKRRRGSPSDGAAVRAPLTLRILPPLIALIFCLACGPGALTARAESTSPGSKDIFARNHTIVWDEELIMPHFRVGYAECIASCYFPETFEEGKWVNAGENRIDSVSPLSCTEAPGQTDATLIRDRYNQAFLAQAWCPPDGGAIPVTLVSVGKTGLGDDKTTFDATDGGAPGRGFAMTAGDFTGDMATELVVAHVDGYLQNLHFSVMPASTDVAPVFTEITDIHPVFDFGVRLATGDADGDMIDELAALYMTPTGQWQVALFTVSADRSVALRATHDLDFSGVGSAEGCFDLTFADWDGSGKAKLACGVLTHEAGDPSDRRFVFQLLDLALSEEAVVFTEVFHDTLREVSVGQRLVADAGDLDSDGRDELVFADLYVKEEGRSGSLLQVVAHDLSDTGSQEPYRIHSQTLYTIGMGGTYSDLDLAVGSFTGQLNPAAHSNNTAQAAVSVTRSDGWISEIVLLSCDDSGISLSGLVHPEVTGQYPAHLVTGDLDRDSVILGDPTHITLENQITPVLFLEEPPKHIDGNASGDVTNYTRRSDLFLQYAQNESESKTTTNRQDTDTSLAASLGTQFTTGVNLGFTSFSVKEKLTFSTSVDSKYEDIDKDYSSQSTSLSGQTNRDDYVLFRCHTVHVWRYPILGWFRIPESSDVEGQAYYQVVIPDSGAQDQALHLIPGRNVDWYQPTHMNGNVLSYPSETGQVPGYSDDELLSSLVTLDIGGGNSSERTIRWQSESTAEKLKSVKVAMGVDSETQFSGSGFASGGTTVTARVKVDRSLSKASSCTTSVAKGNAFDMKIPAASSPLAYSVMPLMYKTEGGILKTGHVVGNIFGNFNWGYRYASAPDLALNLPHTWEFDQPSYGPHGEVWKWSDEPDAREIRGIFFRDAEGMDLGVSIPYSEPFTVAVRVHNFSLKPVHDPVSVSFQAATVDPGTGECGEKFDLGTTAAGAISEWGASRNWEWAILAVDSSDLTGVTEGNYRIFVTVDPGDQYEELPGHDLNEAFDNNRGWFDVFFYCEDGGEGTAKTVAGDDMASLVCALDADEPEDGLTYAAGEEITFRGSVTNESDRSVMDLLVFFYDGDPDEGGRAFDLERVPGLLPGETAALSVSHAFEENRSREVFMEIPDSTRFAPNAESLNSVAVPMEDGSDGCMVGHAGPGGVLGMALMIGSTLFLMRRR